MSIKVHFCHRKHPSREGDYVQLKSRSRGLYTFDMLADDISHYCSLTRADVAGCMEALIEFTTQRLLDGYNVQYHNFGSFNITLDTTLLTEEYFQTHRVRPQSVIKDFKIRFAPCLKLRNKIRGGAEVQLVC